MFNTGIGSVHPAGGSATQRTGRVNTQQRNYRQQVIATRQIELRQQPRILANPRQDVAAVQRRQQQAAQADRRAQHIAVQNIRLVQDQVPDPRRATNVLYGQALSQIRRVNDIGRHTKIATNTHLPLQQRASSLRYLRTNYGIPVTQQNFQQFRQAQKFHEFLHDGKEGDTFAVPTNQKGPGLHRVSQTYEMRKVRGEVTPVAVSPDTSLSVGGLLSGHPYRQHGYKPDISVHEAIGGQTGGIAHGFTHAGVDLTNYGTELIPKGKVGTPLRRGLTELATLPIQTPSSIYGLASAATSAATGNTKPISEIAKSFSEDDPVGRLLTHGDFSAFAKHPGIAAVELFGGLSAVNRAAGRVTRGTARLPDEGFATQWRAGKPANIRRVRGIAGAPELDTIQRYGKGYVTERVQRGRDTKAKRSYFAARGAATKARIKADRAERAGNMDEASRYRSLANDLHRHAELLNPDRIVTARREHQPGIKGAVRGAVGSLRQPVGDLEAHGDLAEGISQGRQRSERGHILAQALGKRGPFNRGDKQIDPAVLKGPVSEVAGLMAQGLIAPSKAAIVDEVVRLADRARTLTGDKLLANEHLRTALSFVAKNYSDADLRGAVRETAVRYGEVQKGVESEADKLGTLPAGEARWAKARTWADKHLPNISRNAQGRIVQIVQAPRDFSHWEKAVKTARQDLKRAQKLNPTRTPTRQVQAWATAIQRLKAEKAKGLTEGVEREIGLGEIEGAWQTWANRTGGLGPDEAAFISHRPNSGRGGDFNQRQLPVKGVPTKARSGSAHLEGTTSHGREAQVGTLSRLTVVNGAVKSFQETLARGALRLSNGKIIHESTKAKALEAYRRLAYGPDGRLKPGYLPETEVTAVRTNPVGGRETQLEQTIHNTDEAGFLADGTHATSDLITDALKGTDLEGYKGGWAVMPASFANRLAHEHAVVTAGAHPGIRAITQAFRNTVLPFSPTWLTGNVVEAAMRAAFIGAGPGSYQFEAKVIAKLAEQGRHDLIERYLLSLGSGHLGSTSNFAVRATADSLKDSRLQGVMRAAHDLYEANTSGRNAARATADLVRSYNDWIMHTVNGSFETMVKRAMAGRYMREHLVLPENMGKLTAAAVEDAARGIKSSRNMTELTRYVQRAYGQYEHWSPNQRKFMLTYTPFGAWLLNATKFLLINLPKDHPGKLALIAANDSATRQWRRDNGLDLTTGQLPPFLGGSIPTPGWYARLVGVAPGSPIRVGRYTPFGFSNDPLGNVASAFIPQLPLEALAGRDFKGAELRNANGTPYDSFQRAGYFAGQLALSSIPIIGMGVRAATGKHGSAAANVRGVLNPFEPVSRPAGSGGGSSGGNPFDSAGSGGGGSKSGNPFD